MPTVTTYEALLSGYTWNGVEVSGRPVFLTYSFQTAPAASASGYYPGAFLDSFQPFSTAEQAIARQALQVWADASGVTFFEVPGGQGDVRFGKYDFSLGDTETKALAGFAYNPTVHDYPEGAAEFDLGGDVFIDLGQADFGTLVHEVGHALGLKHPFEGETTLLSAFDDLRHTVMTYNGVGGPATGLGTLDIEAIQHLYGSATADGAQVSRWSWDSASYILTQGGSALDDTIAGVAVADRISGSAGNDYVFSRAGADLLDGEFGNDTLAGGDGADTVRGGLGDDLLQGDPGNDLLQGGDGDDEMWGLEGANILSGDTGDDTLFGGQGLDRLDGGSGDDVLVVTFGPAVVDGGDGFDELWLVQLPTTGASLSYASLNLDGGSYRGIERIALVGGSAADTVQGGALPDILYGDAGADSLSGGAGDDELDGETGADTVLAGQGADTITDTSGANYLRGDEGNDQITGGSNFDDINGNMGSDTGSGGLGDDWVVGGKDADSLYGEAGDDIVYGNIGNDSCDGGDGADIVRGGQDNDVVLGGAGNDFVSGDRGDDTVTGGAGADNFHTFGEAGIDRVTDFNLAEGDRVQLDPGTAYTVAQVGSDTVISMTGGGQMILVGVAMTSLSGNWIFGA